MIIFFFLGGGGGGGGGGGPGRRELGAPAKRGHKGRTGHKALLPL